MRALEISRRTGDCKQPCCACLALRRGVAAVPPENRASRGRGIGRSPFTPLVPPLRATRVSEACEADTGRGGKGGVRPADLHANVSRRNRSDHALRLAALYAMAKAWAVCAGVLVLIYGLVLILRHTGQVG